MGIKRIGFIGHLAYNEAKFDGQTVSSRLLATELEKITVKRKIVIVDTCKSQNRILFFAKLIRCLFSCSHIVFMLSENGMKALLPVFYCFSKLFRKRIYHRVIGGNINKYVEENRKWVKYLNSFSINWVQSDRIVQKLWEQGVSNGKYLRNFRDAEPISIDEITDSSPSPRYFCTFCRVTKSKGISEAIESVASINQETGKIVAILHVFGPIDDSYREEFDSLLVKHKEYVVYKGIVTQDKVVTTLKQYYYHLFPTTWEGEGFPGTIIDCYNAALPTIATNWAYNSDFLEDGKTGYLYNWKMPEMLVSCIKKALDETDNEHHLIRVNNLKEAEKYRASVVMKQIIGDMND